MCIRDRIALHVIKPRTIDALLLNLRVSAKLFANLANSLPHLLKLLARNLCRPRAARRLKRRPRPYGRLNLKRLICWYTRHMLSTPTDLG